MSITYTHITNGEERQLANVEVLTGATTLTAEDSAKVFILKAAAGAQVTLPAVAISAGNRFKFVVGLNFATTNWTVKSLTNVIEGGVDVNSTNVAGVNENTISFVNTAESLGDFVELACDGVHWFVSGNATTAGAITLTAV